MQVDYPSPLAPPEITLGSDPWTGPLVDRLGRVHTDLRVSVTDRCNIRCFYCMPAEQVTFKPRHELLTFEEITRFARIAARLGVRKLRLTGGEPLVRRDLPQLIEQLSAIAEIDDIALTTNGILLDEQAEALKQAGLKRLNISLDAMNAETFEKISRRPGFERVLSGIAAARHAGFEQVKLNTVAIRDLTEAEIIPLGRFAREHGYELRFIEFMPLDADGKWNHDQVLSGSEIRALLEAEFGPLQPIVRDNVHQPAVDFQFADGGGRVGFINPVTQPFCGDCNRLRLTAEGQVRNCLFSTDEWDARAKLRGGASDEMIARLVRDCVAHKRPGHGIDTEGFLPASRPMYQIGG